MYIWSARTRLIVFAPECWNLITCARSRLCEYANVHRFPERENVVSPRINRNRPPHNMRHYALCILVSHVILIELVMCARALSPNSHNWTAFRSIFERSYMTYAQKPSIHSFFSVQVWPIAIFSHRILFHLCGRTTAMIEVHLHLSFGIVRYCRATSVCPYKIWFYYYLFFCFVVIIVLSFNNCRIHFLFLFDRARIVSNSEWNILFLQSIEFLFK